MIKLSRNIKNEILTLIGIFSFIYPLVLILRKALFSDENLFLNLLIDFLILFIGFSFSKLYTKKNKEFFNIGISIIISFVIILSAGIIKGSLGDLLKLVYELTIALFYYLLGYNYKREIIKNYFSDGICKAAIILFAISLISSFYFKNLLVLKPYILIFTYIFIAVYILEKNKYKLEWAFKQNGVDGSVFSTKITSYNRNLSLLIFTLIVLLSNIKIIILIFGTFLKFLGFIFIKLTYYVTIFVGFIFSYFNSGKMKNQQEENAQTIMLRVDKPSLVALVLDTIFWALFFYMLYKLLPLLFKKFKKDILSAIKYIKQLISKFNKKADEENDEYVDSMEILQHSVNKKENKNFKLKKKRNEKYINKILDPIEKIRFIYGILLEKIHYIGIEIKSSDTTGEIYDKSLGISGIDQSFKEITEIYNIVRYKDEIPSKDELSKTLGNYNNVVSIIKNHKQ